MGCGNSKNAKVIVPRNHFPENPMEKIELEPEAKTEFTKHYGRPEPKPDTLKVFSAGFSIKEDNWFSGEEKMVRWRDMGSFSFRRYEIKGHFEFAAIVADADGSHSLKWFDFMLSKDGLNELRDTIMGPILCEYSEYSMVAPKIFPKRLITRKNGVEFTHGSMTTFRSEFVPYQCIYDFKASTSIMAGEVRPARLDPPLISSRARAQPRGSPAPALRPAWRALPQRGRVGRAS